jgi:hypothetical protein
MNVPMTRRVWDVFVVSLLGGSRFWAETAGCASYLWSEQQRLGCDMTDKSEFSFAVVRFNERTYQSGGVVAIIKGVEAAKRTLANFDWCQSEENRREGWRYFLEKTDLRPGMDPEKATKLRQVRFDLQQS